MNAKITSIASHDVVSGQKLGLRECLRCNKTQNGSPLHREIELFGRNSEQDAFYDVIGLENAAHYIALEIFLP